MRSAPAFLTLLTIISPCADWLTDGGDVMRTNWQRDEKIINTSNANKDAIVGELPGFRGVQERVVVLVGRAHFAVVLLRMV